MALPTTFSFGKGVFFLGNGATPTEAFNKICGFESGTLTRTTNTGETTIPDCDNPDLPVPVARDKVSQDWSMEFEGVMAKDAIALLEAAHNATGASNVRLHLVGGGSGGATPDYRWSGPAIIDFTASGQRGERWMVTVSAQGAGALTSASVAALV